ncbi:MAG: tetratricopeptide repeat protein, partial [Hyphomicrobiales bacterium]
MSDIFREIDEELRQERLTKLWKLYGSYVIGGVVALVLAIGGYKFYVSYELSRAGEAGAQFAQATKLISEGKYAQAESILAALSQNGYASYPILARLQQAGALAAEKRLDDAVAVYDQIAQDTGADIMFRDLAKVRAAIILVDSASPEEISRRMDPLITSQGIWHHTARELVALSTYRAADYKAADKLYGEILADVGTPARLRARAEMMRALI